MEPSTLILETSAVVLECQHETIETEGGSEEAKIDANVRVDDGEKAVKVVDRNVPRMCRAGPRSFMANFNRSCRTSSRRRMEEPP